MKARLKALRVREILWPAIRKFVIKAVVAAILIFLWDYFANSRGLVDPVRYAAPVIGVFYLIMAWFTFLRLDNARIPRIFSKRKSNKGHAGPGSGAGNFSTVIETEPETEDDLTQDERDVSSIISWLICGILAIIAGIIF